MATELVYSHKLITSKHSEVYQKESRSGFSLGRPTVNTLEPLSQQTPVLSVRVFPLRYAFKTRGEVESFLLSLARLINMRFLS